MSKKVKTFGLISILLCNMMGTSAFLSSRNILRSAISCKISLLLWLLGAILSILFGLCYAELGSTYPSAGGDVVYLSKAFSPILGTIYSLCSLFLVLPSCSSLFCRMIHEELLGESYSETQYIILTTILILGLCIFIVLLGNDVMVLVGKISFFIKVITVLFFLVTAVITIIFKKSSNFVTAFNDPKGAVSNRAGYMGLIIGMLYSMWGFDGWNCGNYIADGINNPEFTFKIGIFSSIVLSYIFISIINISFLLILPYDVYIGKDESFIVAYLKLLGINFSDLFISMLTVVIPLFGSLLGIVIVYKGITYGLLSKKMEKSDVYGCFGLLFLTILFSYVKHHEILLKFMQICTILFYTLCCYGLLVLRYRKPDLHRPFKVHISIPVISSAVGTMLIVAFCTVKV
jgi:amino acid transporter